jgi:hypothetical protein
MFSSKRIAILPGLVFCVFGILSLSLNLVNAQDESEQQANDTYFRGVDGKLIPSDSILRSTPIENDPIGDMLSILESVGKSDPNSTVVFRTTGGVEVTKNDIVGGLISLEARNDLTNQLSNSAPFSNILDLSPEQSLEIKKIQTELSDKLRIKARGIKDPAEIVAIFRETNAEFTQRLKSVLLPFQLPALFKYSVESVGVLPAVVRLSQGELLETKLDEEKLEQIATNHIEKIESTVIQLKKDLARDFINLLSQNDREAMERALGCSLEEVIMKASLERLEKQLDLIKNGGTPSYSTFREFAEELSRDTNPELQHKQN